MKLPHTLLIACLGAAPLCAQQVEQKAETQKPASAGGATLPVPATTPGSAPAPGNSNSGSTTDGRNSTAPSGHPHSHGHGMPQPEKKPVAYIGVLTREVPPELRAQFSLAEGFGLLVGEVMPDSPAKTAGLKVYDVLVKFEDQQLVNMEQLMALVRAKKKGDVVKLSVITGGKETQVSITLGERLIEAQADHPPHHGYTGMAQPNGLPGFHGTRHHGEQLYGFPQQGHEFQQQLERLQHLQQELREYQQRVQEWTKSGGSTAMPQPPRLNFPGASQQPHAGGRHHPGHQSQTGISIPPGTNLQQFKASQSQSAAQMTRRDDSGEFTLKNENGKKTFFAHPKNGQEQSWPVNTEAERQAVPQEFRDKLRMMDGANNGIRIEIKPGPGLNAPGNPAPTEGGHAPALPPVKAKTTSA